MADYPTSIPSKGSGKWAEGNNLGNSTLNGAITDSQTSIVVAGVSTVTPWPSADFFVRVDNELLFCSSRSGTTLTVTRGFGGTTAATHDDTAVVKIVLPYEAFDYLFDELAAIATQVGTTGAFNFATEAYADGLVEGLRGKGIVQAVADSNVASLSGTTTLDGVSLVADDVVLLTAQSTATENGAWVIKAGAWVRPANFAVGSSASNAFWLVEAGTTYQDTRWWCTTDAPNDVVDTDNLVVVQFSGAAEITAGDGVTKTGNTLSVNVDDAGIEIVADTLQLKDDGVAGSKLAPAVAGVGLVQDGSGNLDVDQAFSPNWTGDHDFGAQFILSGDISPTALAAQADDYSPTGLATASVLRLTATGAQSITGLAGGADGRVIVIHNVDTADTITLVHESASSTAANRFIFQDDANVAIAPDASVILQYDSTSSRWRQVGGSGGGAGGPAAMSISLPAGSAIIPSTAGAELETVNGTNLPYHVLNFDAATDESAFFQFVMPQSYDGGTFDIHVHSFAAATSGDALLDVSAAVIEAGEVVDQALTSLGTITITPAGTTLQLVVDSDTGNTLTGLAGGDLVILKITRDANNASDTMTGDLRVVAVEIDYTPA